MLLTKEVEVVVNSRTFKHYKELGYLFEHKGDKIIVKVEDLSMGSHTLVNVQCDYCKKIKPMQYKKYLSGRINTEKDACFNCIKHKTSETVYKKYNTDNYSKTEEFKDKYKNICLEKYGVENVSQIEEIKIKKEETCLANYGVKIPAQNSDIINKMKATCLERYGVENVNLLTDFREKVMVTSYKNGNIPTSSQQIYLRNLYNGKLNYPIKKYPIDVCLINEKIAIEYDGGGHNLAVKMGYETQEEFNKKEIIRNNIIKREGYKQIRITSSRDYLPSDEILLQMLEQAKEYFNNTTHTWVEYDIDTSLMRNAENKEGVFFDYGNLRKIKKAS